jgi:hypothetical protein
MYQDSSEMKISLNYGSDSALHALLDDFPSQSLPDIAAHPASPEWMSLEAMPDESDEFLSHEPLDGIVFDPNSGSCDGDGDEKRDGDKDKGMPAMEASKLQKKQTPPAAASETTYYSSVPSVMKMQEQVIAEMQILMKPDSEEFSGCTDKDVLMGRGGTARHHPGNQWYLAAKTRLQKKYLLTHSTDEKSKISQELVDSVYARGGRFLEKLVDGTYLEVDEESARMKASQALRVVPRSQGQRLGIPFQQDVASLMHASATEAATGKKDRLPLTAAPETVGSSAGIVARMQDDVIAALQAMIKAEYPDSAKMDALSLQKERSPLATLSDYPPALEAVSPCESDREDDNEYVYTYTDQDVIMGRGGNARHHPGNQWYLAAKARLQDNYLLTLSSDEKRKISQQLIESVYARGGRFLEKVSKGTFVEVDSKRARIKASQALREVPKSCKK